MRFVVISLPPAEIRDQIDALRRPLNALVGTHQALRYPPHITLRTGLVCPDDLAEEVSRSFLAHAAQFGPVSVVTRGVFFTSYGTPEARGMVGWSVEASVGLMELHRNLLAYSAWQKGPQGPYQPHLTLAFDDLTPDGVEVIRRALAHQPPVPDFAWTVDAVALYHEGPEGWVEWSSINLKSS